MKKPILVSFILLNHPLNARSINCSLIQLIPSIDCTAGIQALPLHVSPGYFSQGYDYLNIITC